VFRNRISRQESAFAAATFLMKIDKKNYRDNYVSMHDWLVLLNLFGAEESKVAFLLASVSAPN
jgi:hypothetical protein